MKFDNLSNRVIGCVIEVHRQLGPGLLEGIGFKLQYPQPVDYKGIRLECGYRIDHLFFLDVH